jgi:hypothetical protein
MNGGDVMRHGAFDISRIAIDPDLYSITFAWPQTPPGQTARTCAGLGELDGFLQQAGIAPDRIGTALHDARVEGRASIPDIVIGERELESLGLLTSSATKV